MITASSSSSSTHLIHNFLRLPKPPSSVCLFLRPFCLSASISQSNHHNKPRLQSFSSKPLSSPSTSLVAKSLSSIDEPDFEEDEESDEEDYSAEEYEDELGSGLVPVGRIEDSEASEEISEIGLGDKVEKTEKMKKKARGSALKLSIKEKKELASYAHSLDVSRWSNDKDAEMVRLCYVKPEVVSWSPPIIVLHNFLSSEGVKSDLRTSSGMFPTHVERSYPIIQAIEKRVPAFSQLPAENEELIQVLRYE